MVGVETLHAQGAIPLWGQREVWMPVGHGWAMVVSQRVALELFHKKVNPTRYGSLQIPQAEASGQANPMLSGAQDAISQEILSQVGVLLKRNAPNGPFAGLKVTHLIMGGSSQTGGTTLRYIQESHAKARLGDGKPIYDGYLPMEAFATEPISGIDVPVMHVVGEGDFALFSSMQRGGKFGTRPDGDAPNDRYREYQFPASSHVPTRGISDPKQIFSTLADVSEPGESLCQFPSAPFYRAAATNFVAWVMKGVPPPKAPPIEMVNGEVVRDEHGNAKGGIRHPYVDVPAVRYVASAPVNGMNPARRMIGLQEPLHAEKLRAMYTSRAEYLKRFNKEIDRLVSARWLLAKDGAQLKAEEARNPPL
jgi:hypothetical protein